MKACERKKNDENGETLHSVPDCYKNQEMCKKAVDNCPYALEFVPECFMTQEICDKVVNRWFCIWFYSLLV